MNETNQHRKVTAKDRSDFCKVRLCPRCEFNMGECMINYWKFVLVDDEVLGKIQGDSHA